MANLPQGGFPHACSQKRARRLHEGATNERNQPRKCVCPSLPSTLTHGRSQKNYRTSQGTPLYPSRASPRIYSHRSGFFCFLSPDWPHLVHGTPNLYLVDGSPLSHSLCLTDQTLCLLRPARLPHSHPPRHGNFPPYQTTQEPQPCLLGANH